ncbi:membrane protein [Mycobacteroides abscessus subsp. abscessus]|uniref:hypothetical protein n=1 Tax=Mycobacteroides abscessus TaxID=36809 RepID=UPI0009A78978|nr:hypothetical protein [Mycobacteroides abscessus]SKR61786.1 membrane protein [Mycobacteroides abscessus subsp. abscessus]
MNTTLQPTPVAGPSLWKYRLVVGAAAVLAVLALTLTIIKWSTPRPAGVVTTATASAPTYPEDQVAAAKKEACETSVSVGWRLTDVHNSLWNTPRDAPEQPGALAEYQRVSLIETEYLKTKIRPETPQAVRTAIEDYISAILAEVDAVVRNAAASTAVETAKSAGKRISAACE